MCMNLNISTIWKWYMYRFPICTTSFRDVPLIRPSHGHQSVGHVLLGLQRRSPGPGIRQFFPTNSWENQVGQTWDSLMIFFWIQWWDKSWKIMNNHDIYIYIHINMRICLEDHRDLVDMELSFPTCIEWMLMSPQKKGTRMNGFPCPSWHTKFQYCINESNTPWLMVST